MAGCNTRRRLDGYANMARAALMLHEVTGEECYLAAAKGWAAVLDRHFWDDDGGGLLLHLR